MKAKNARGRGCIRFSGVGCLLARCDGHNRAVLAKRPYWDFLVGECKRELDARPGPYENDQSDRRGFESRARYGPKPRQEGPYFPIDCVGKTSR
jgi:hypothetical protein